MRMVDYLWFLLSKIWMSKSLEVVRERVSAPRNMLRARQRCAVGALNCEEWTTYCKPGYKAICQSLF